MATLTKDDIGTAWIDLVADLSLVNSSSYIIQNVSPYPMSLKESALLPTADEFGHVIFPSETWSFTVGSDGVYVRNQGDDNKKILIAVTVSV